MSTSALRAAIHQQIEKGPESVIKVLKSVGVKVSQIDESAISNGWLDRFSDAQLLERFNQTVLERLGIRGDFSGVHDLDNKGRSTDMQQSYTSFE